MKANKILSLLFFLLFTAPMYAQTPTDLLKAIQSNDLRTVKLIHPDSLQLNTRDANHATPLFLAAYKGSLEMVKYLVRCGADPFINAAICLDDSCGSYYGNLTGVAAGEGNLALLRYCIEDLNIPTDDLEWNPATGKKDGWTALTWACNKNNSEIITYLIKKNSNPKVNAWQPLEQLITRGNDTIAEIIAQYYDNSDDISPDLIIGAATHGLDKVVEKLLKIRKDQHDYTAALSYYLLASNAKKKLDLDKAYGLYESYYSEIVTRSDTISYESAARGIKSMADIKFMLHQHNFADSLSQIWLHLSAKYLGTSSESYAVRLREYADSLMAHNVYKLAEIPFRELLTLWDSLEGPSARSHAVCLNNIGWNLNKQTRFQEAEPYLKESVALWKIQQTKEDAELCTTLWNLGDNLIGQKKFNEAEDIWKERLVITEKLYGINSSQMADALNDLGWLYRLSNRYDKAESNLKESLHIMSNVIKPNIELFKIASENLFNVYIDQKSIQKALEIKITLLDTLIKYNVDTIKIIDLHGEVAGLYKNLKHYDFAISSFKYQLELETRLGNNNKWIYWDIHREIADCYFEKADYKNALDWYIKYEKSGFRAAKEKMAIVYMALKNYEMADQWYSSFFEELKTSNIRSFRDTDKGFKFLTVDWNQHAYHLGYSIAYWHTSENACRTSFNISLHAKNAILEESKQINHFVKTSSNRTFQDSLILLAEVQEVYANLFHFKSKDNVIENEKILRKQIKSLQSYLSKVYYESSPDLKKSFDANWLSIQSMLSTDEAAIEFVDFSLHRTNWTDSTLYAALVLRPGWEAPRFVPLFEAKTLATLLSDNQTRKAAYAESLYPDDGRAVRVGNTQTSLYQLIWAKLDSLLQGVQTIYYSPSGYLNRLNLGAIANPNKQIAAERYHLVQMASTRQLLQKRLVSKPNRSAVLFGGLQYSADSLSLTHSVAKYQDKKDVTTRSDPDPSGMTTVPLDTLQFTREEVNEIAPILKKFKYKVTTLTDLFGTEEALYHLCISGNSPGILHFSTHGFFFSDPEKDSLANNRKIPFALSNSSMLRSGIVFSGCNRFWTTGMTYQGLHDGVLTAYEAAQLDLSNTELVVLSACETGLGDLNVEGGVFGLQRAFIQAGAHYVIMSLWNVNDSTTKDFMITFYKKLLQDKKLTIPDAFRYTQLEMRRKYTNPYFWAPFILVE